nr:PREDICTED: transcriptional regulator STERILE APETALA isoform X3 [Daucus carota subsp. sativus]
MVVLEAATTTLPPPPVSVAPATGSGRSRSWRLSPLMSPLRLLSLKAALWRPKFSSISSRYVLLGEQCQTLISCGRTSPAESGTVTISAIIHAGFSDGTVRLFHLPNMLYLSTFRPQNRNRLGHFSPAVSGIILSESRLVFASLDGDIHVAMTDNAIPPRRAHLGDVVNDGALVDFNGCSQWWVGLYAGVPGRAFHVWNGVTEELVFIGGTLTDHEAVRGWHLLTELTELIGRVRLTSRELAVACTSLRFIVFDLRDQVIVLGEEEFPRRLMVGAFDARHEEFVIVDRRGSASVRRVGTLEEVCRFDVRGASQRGVLGCTNGGYALMCVGGLIRAWEIEHGEHLYSLVERIGEATALVADERYLVACSSDNTIHLWDFGVQ